MKRVIAFALALAAVFGVSFALYKPEEARQSRETYDREWVGYFFALEEFEGRACAVKNGEKYDFGVPGVPIFLTITEIRPGEPGYEEGSEFNCVIGAVVGEGADSHGMSVSGSDDGETYEIGGDIESDTSIKPPLYECYVYRTSTGDYYAEGVKVNGMWSIFCGPGFILNQTREISDSQMSSWTMNGEKRSRTVKVNVSLVDHAAAETAIFTWLDGDKNALSREEYTADAIPGALTAPEGAAMLVVTQENTNDTVTRTLCTAEDAFTTVYVPSVLSGLLHVADVALDWGEEGI